MITISKGKKKGKLHKQNIFHDVLLVIVIDQNFKESMTFSVPKEACEAGRIIKMASGLLDMVRELERRLQSRSSTF